MADVTMWQDQAAREVFMVRGRELFESMKDQFSETGGVVALDLDSSDVFIGETLGQANDAARQHYLDQWLYFVRVDNPEAAVPLPVW